MNSVPVIGAGTDFTINADGYIAQFITDVGDPNKLLIPAGNWNFETYFSASSGGGSPRFYIELYKYNGATFTLIATNSATPEYITGGTSIDLYFTALAVPATTLLVTDRLAVRFYVIHSGRTITMHTEDSHLSQIITTFSSGLNALNGLTDQAQYFAVGTSGSDFNISSVTDTHTFNLPNASATARGVITTGTQTIAGQKTFSPNVTAASLIAQGTIFTPTLVASANNDVLVGLDIAPTFTNGAFTGVTNYAQRINGSTFQTIDGTSTLYTSNVPSVNAFSFHFSVPTVSNFFLRSDINSVYLNSPSTIGNIFFRIGNATKGQFFGTTGNLLLQNGGVFTDIASSRLTINSTTQGFLPPRMTTAQKNAIVTPATGLVVYDNDLLNQSQYNGTSWVSGNQIILNEFPNTQVSGTVTETLLSTFTFPANTFPAICIPNIKAKFYKTGGLNTATWRLKVNTTNNFATAALIATFTFTIAGATIVFNRNPLLRSNVLSILNSTTSASSDEVTLGIAETTTTFNTSSTMYLFVSVQMNGINDLAVLQSIKITN